MCQAPSLVSAPEQFDLSAHLPGNIRERLIDLDNAPGDLLNHLAQDRKPRLGHYFEKLYQFLMTKLMGWNLLLANLQIREDGLTLGELDFVLQNPATGAVEHHEIAVKFYLGMPLPDGNARWYGPNAQDRLDLKTDRIRHHQLQLTDKTAARSALADAGIHTRPVRRLFMPGYLFYPAHISVSTPESAPPEHARGIWCRAGTLTPNDLANWSVLNKPHWLGPCQQTIAPDPDDAVATLRQVQLGGPPRLLAKMQERPNGAGWQETERLFIVPEHWPVQG